MPENDQKIAAIHPFHSHVYLDESGDLGWKFDAPYRHGGSSRYLTIAYLITPISHCDIPKRIVRDFYKKFGFNTKVEVKGSDLKKHHKEFICKETIQMIEKYKSFRLGSITIHKEKVGKHIRDDSNLLYHYLIGDAIINKIDTHATCKLTRDNRSVKSVSVKSCIDYLQTLLWLHLKKETVLKDNPTHSHTDLGVIFIDWITNIVWTKYEDNYPEWCNTLSAHIHDDLIQF